MSKMEDMQSYFDEYPEALRKARASSSLTLAELARISGVPYNSICSVNSGTTKQPLLYYSAATCKALGLSLDELFGITNTEGSVTQLKRINALEVKAACLENDVEHHRRMNAVYRPLIFCLVGVCTILLCVGVGYIIVDIQLKVQIRRLNGAGRVPGGRGACCRRPDRLCGENRNPRCQNNKKPTGLTL